MPFYFKFSKLTVHFPRIFSFIQSCAEDFYRHDRKNPWQVKTCVWLFIPVKHLVSLLYRYMIESLWWTFYIFAYEKFKFISCLCCEKITLLVDQGRSADIQWFTKLFMNVFVGVFQFHLKPIENPCFSTTWWPDHLVTTFSVFFNCKICFRTCGIHPNF